jgi:TrbL/VirB6 plasmid conjugal transfer protein
MGNIDIFALVTQAIQQALSGKTSLFLGVGISLWGSFATLIILFFGAEWMFAPSAMNGARVMKLVLQLIICKAILVFYVTPILGQSFTGLIVNEATYITNQIGQVNYDLVDTATTQLIGHVPQPALTDIKGILVFTIISSLAGLVKAIVFFVGSFGFIVQAILLLLGPLFIPFYIVPQLDFLAWNWFKAFLQYSFYGVLGNAYAYVYTIIVSALYQQIGAYLQNTGSDAWTIMGGLLWLVIMGIAGAFLVPTLVAHLFGGQSGSGAATAVAATAAKAL